MEEFTSAVWSATLKGEHDRANQLIRSGADINEPRITETDSITSLLHYATMQKDVKRMRLLIKHGANCNAPDSLKRTPLHWAVIYTDSPDVVEVLIKGGAIVDARDYEQCTPLFMATCYEHFQSVRKLVARGASINAVNTYGENLLHAAALNSYSLKMTKMLISLKINIDAEDGSGNSPLHYAVVYDTNIARLFLDNGADVNKKGKEGNSPLCIAVARWGGLPSVRLLLKRGARINDVNDAGNTALHEACMRKSEDAVVLLVKFGADMNVSNREGKTALQLLPRNRPFSITNARIIIPEVVKRAAFGNPICEGYRQIVQSCKKYSKLDQECHEEIKRMRSERIDVEDCDVTFFHIFSKNEDKLAALARNKNIVTAFETSNFLALCRVYAVDLSTKFETAKQRANFLISIEDCLIDVLGETLPAPILQNIAAHVEDYCFLSH